MNDAALEEQAPVRRTNSRVLATAQDGIQVKKLEDWLPFTDVGEILGISRAGVAWMVWNAGEFDIDKDVRAVTEKMYVIRRSAVLEKKRQRDAEQRLKDSARITRK